MKQAISGVAPPALQEVTVMAVWPSVAKYSLGRIHGQLYSIKAGISVLTVGNLIALASIPAALVLYFLRIAPFIGTRYRLTNRRIVVERGLTHTEERSVPLDRFDSVVVDVRPGQEWYDAGDLVFYLGKTETFRLEGVSRPHAFRACCVKSQKSHAGVKKARAQQPAMA